MIVMVALINDSAILSIAYDNIHYKDRPCSVLKSWHPRHGLWVVSV